jgi:hypothetical protein
VSSNTIKAVLNRAGLDESTSIHSRAFELFSESKTPLQVAITLNLEAEKAQYHHQYLRKLQSKNFCRGFVDQRKMASFLASNHALYFSMFQSRYCYGNIIFKLLSNLQIWLLLYMYMILSKAFKSDISIGDKRRCGTKARL